MATHSDESRTLDARDTFTTDILEGLQRKQKQLPSKYFYDARGDEIFQRIMHAPSYYLSRAEHNILSTRSEEIAADMVSGAPLLEVAELGPGDATKSIFLLRELARRGALHRYLPIDISGHVIRTLTGSLSRLLPGIPVHGMQGDYLHTLAGSPRTPGIPRLVLMLGANIGNFPPEEAMRFCKRLGGLAEPGDMLIIGIDLKKNPRTILEAYNDPAGLTRSFNINLLKRINREAPADFDLDGFSHYPTYDPETGACKSFLVSEKDAVVHVAGVKITFHAGETILTEISQKYSVEDTTRLALSSGFEPVQRYFDENKWFVDCLWRMTD